MPTIPAYTINGLTRPELIIDGSGNIVLDDAASAFAQAYGVKALYLGCPPGTPYPPVLPSILAPIDTNNAANTVAENAAMGATVGLTAHSTSLLGFPITYSLIGDSSGGGFKINSATGVVTVNDPSKIDFESAPGHSYSVTVKANDGILTTFRTFTIGVSNVAPSAPTDANAAANTVVEGAGNGTDVGIKASATDVNGGAVTYSLTNDANGAFAINATTGVITVKDSSKIDFETAPGHAYTITAKASDSSGASSTQTFTINVTDVALSTPTDSNNATNTVAEGAANGSFVGLTASAVDPNGPATTYSLIDSANGAFAINSTTGVVTVADSSKIDFETAPGHAYSIIVKASNVATSTTQTFSIAVSDVRPSTPTDSNSATNTVFEGAANGTSVGVTASSTDVNGPAVTYSLTGDTSGGGFTINAVTGVVTVADSSKIDFESSGGSYTVTAQASDGTLTSTQSFTIGVANVNEAPAGTDKAVSTAEDTGYVFSVADFGFTDPSDSSAPNSLQAVRITTAPGAGTLTNNGNAVNAGDFISAADIAAGHLIFTPAANASGAGYAALTFQVQDNGGTANGGVNLDQSANTLTINVTAVNDAPTATGLTQSLTISEDAAATGLFGAPLAPVADIDSATVTARLTLANPAAGVLTGGGFTATANPGEYIFTGSPVAVTAALNSVQFDSANNFNGSTSVNVVISDGANGPQGVNPTGTVSITVNAVNDAPTATNLLQQLTVDEDAAATTLFTAAPVVADVDSANVTARLVLSPSAGVLTGGGFTLTANPGEYTFSGTPAQVTAALAAVKFDSADNFNGATFVNVFIDDGASGPQGTNPVGSVQITVNAVNDAPTATGLTQSLSINEDDAATILFTVAPVVSDIDSATVTATLTLDAAAGVLNNAGAGVLAAGVLTYTISGTAAAVSTALAGITYDSADDFNGITDVHITISDGANGPQGSNPVGTGTVTINAVNDAPTATNLTQSLTVSEDAAATTLFTAAPVVADIDSSTVTATLTLDAAAGVLNGVGAGVLAAGVLTYTITGAAASVNAALAAVTYDSADNFNGTTSVGVTIDDGGNGPQGTNPTGTVSITVNAVNDAPTATNLSQSLVINEDAAATTLFTAAPVVADIDSTTVTATLTVDAAAGTLAGAGMGVLAAGVLTYTITGTAAEVNTALAAVTYDSAQDFFGSTSVGVTISDGAGGPQGLPEPTGTIDITVNPVNDAPTVAATANNPSYVPGVDLFSGVTASTVESGQVISQVVLTVSNVLGNDESLSIDGDTVALLDGTVSGAPTATLGVNYSVSVSGNVATITISSPGLTGAQASALIDGLTYTNTTVAPNELPRVVTIVSLTDDGGTALGGVATGTPGIASTVNFNTPPVAHDDAASATEAGGLNNASAGTNASGNVITATGPGDVADTDADAGDTLTVVSVRTGAEGSPTGPGTVNTPFNGLHGSLQINSDGSYTYTVDQSDAAVQALRTSGQTLTDTFNYTVQDNAGAQDFATLTITIHGANDSPIAVADTPTALEAGGAGNGTAGTNPGGNVLTNDIDPDSAANGETMTVQGVAAGTQAGPLTLNVGAGVASANGYGTLTIQSDGTYTYVVDNSNAAVQALRTSGQTLTDTFSYTMHDQLGVTSTTQVTVTIQGANDNPTAVNDTASATEAGGVNNASAGIDPTGNVLTNDTDVDGNGETKTVQGVVAGNNGGTPVTGNLGGPGVQGTYGTLILQADGSYTYQVDQALTDHLLPTDHPTDVFTYTMHDAAGITSTAILTVTVNGANDLPQAVADAGTITEDAAPTLFAVVVNNDVLDPDTAALNSIAITGTVTASSAGNLNIGNGDATAVVVGNQIQVTLGADFQTMAQGETATIAVPYTLTGNAGDTSASTLTVTVTGVNDGVTVIDDVGGSITEDAAQTTYNVRANDVLDVDHTAPNSITIDSVSATDAGGAGITGADVTASVTPGNDIQFTLGSDFQKLSGGESSTITIGYTLHGDQAGDTDSGTLTYTVTGVNDAPAAQDFTFNGANSGIGNTSLVLDNGSGTTPIDPAGPQKTISGNLLSGATDVDTDASSFTITAGTVSNAAGSITYTADGDFTYTPAAGFTGNAVFNYTLNDNDASGNATDTGQITINVATPKVWYVDANAAPGGDGTSDNPFNSFAALNGVTGDGSTNDDVDGANDIIFVYGGTYTGGITLEDGQTLISQSQGLTVNGTALVAASGGNAVINGAVVLGANNTVDGIDFGNSGSASVFALSGNNVGNAVITDSSINNTSGGAVSINGSGTGMNLQFGSVSSSNASTSAILLQDTQGTFNATGGTLNNGGTTAADIRLVGNSNNDNMAFTYGGAINDDQGQLVQITGQTGGTKLFSGAITDGNDGDGQGIDLTSNSGATINFNGGITLSTSGVTAFNASGGGTVNVTGTNHIHATGGSALNINATTIGSGNVTFQDISANGGTSGIVLNNTGTSGHLAVTGGGSTAQGGDSSGGTIQNTTGAGISLTNTLGPMFNNMNIQSTFGSGINGTDVTNFTFTNGTINNSGTGHGVDASNIGFNSSPAAATNNIDGTITITNNVLSNAYYHGVDIQNRAGTIDNATISNNAITSATSSANAQGSGIHIVTFGTGSSAASLTKATIDGNTIANFPLGAGIAVLGGNSNAAGPGGTMGVPNNASNVIAITNNNIHGFNTATPIGSEGIVTVVQGGNGASRSQGNFNVSGNTITDTLGQGIAMSGFGNSTVNAKVNNNIVDTNNIGKLIGSNGIGIGTGVVSSSSETPLMTVEVIGNTVTDYDGHGIRLVALDTNGTLNATVLNNAVGRAAGGGFPSRIRVDSGNENSAGNNTVNLDISGNTGFGTSVAGDAPGIGLRLGDGGAATNVLRIEGFAGGNDVAAENYVAGKNPGMFAGTLGGAYSPAKIAEVIHGSTFGGTGSVPQPLLAVAGGVQAASPTPGETHLTQAQLDSVVAAAIGQWAHAGATAAQLAALSAITFSVADLSGNTVGEHTPGHIVIDADAAGHGWFVDPTPFDNSEFAHAANADGTQLFTDPTNAAAGHLDLLTTVVHEMGHEFGLPDLTAASDVDDLMYIDLANGERRLPDAGDVPVTTGTPGNDTIDAGHGGNILSGGAGADNFVFANIDIHATTPWSLLSALWGAPPATPPALTHVTDYSFAQGDSFDFSALTSSFHGSWASDAQIVRAVEDPSGTFATLQVNAGGPSIASWFNMLLHGNSNSPSSSTASWVDVARLDGIHAGDDVSVLIDGHAGIHMAHVQAGTLV